MQTDNRKEGSPELDTVLEGPDQLDRVFSMHLAQDVRAFPCCASRISSNITSFPSILRLKSRHNARFFLLSVSEVRSAWKNMSLLHSTWCCLFEGKGKPTRDNGNGSTCDPMFGMNPVTFSADRRADDVDSLAPLPLPDLQLSIVGIGAALLRSENVSVFLLFFITLSVSTLVLNSTGLLEGLSRWLLRLFFLVELLDGLHWIVGPCERPPDGHDQWF